MAYSLDALSKWLTVWAEGQRKENYLDKLIETNQVRWYNGQQRTERGKRLRKHLFGSERSPPAEIVKAAIRVAGGAAALATKIKLVIDAGLNAPFGALADALKDFAADRHSPLEKAIESNQSVPEKSIDTLRNQAVQASQGPRIKSAVPVHVVSIGQLLCDALCQMAIEGSKNSLLYGLRGTPEYLGHFGDQWESWITKDLAARTGLRDQIMYPVGCAERFHSLSIGKRGRNFQTCDLGKEVPGPEGIWIECKAIFETILLRYPGDLKFGDRTYYRDYNAEFACADPKKTAVHVSIEQAKIDASKLRCIEAKDGAYIGLLLLEFDRVGHQVSDLGDFRRLRAHLLDDGWFETVRERWSDKVAARAMKGFQEHVSFWARKIV
jgi:hypothetical protein